ncbi:hypothetical protein [Actinophytocola xanthii]|uniref:Uncharacterized protein n=1 Tax=Actinophytocola xanthii TaxID=1912961 RepID=A0A1Q8CQD9_9PSEU|nr:hypothetical protein [Actinophytocola xanthii]OLF16573.1 hypothetical protein BU204_16090 [Actinophytocola xanthii]
MGWQEHYRRRDALDAVIASGGELSVPEPFTDLDELLLALHHRWSMRLAGRLELAVTAAERDPDLDRARAVGEAWRASAADNAALRRILERHADRPVLRERVDAERRALADVAGLTAPGDAAEDRAAVGAAFLALVETRPRRNPVERLLRRLAPSA